MSETSSPKIGVLQAFSPFENKLNWLLLAVPITIYFSFIANNSGMRFIFSMIAIMPLALLMGHATEEIALRTSESLGGLLNATFGNAVEIIIAGLAIYTAANYPDQADTMITVVQASLIGSILGNLLLVLGLSLLWGGINHQKQTFNQQALSMSGSLLLLAVLAMLIPAAVNIGGGASDSILSLSRYAAIVLLVMYGLALLFQLKTHSHIYESDAEVEHEEPKMTNKDAWKL